MVAIFSCRFVVVGYSYSSSKKVEYSLMFAVSLIEAIRKSVFGEDFWEKI